MAKYDLETLVVDVRDAVKNNMTAKIAEINSDKNDAIVLKVPASDAYIMQSWTISVRITTLLFSSGSWISRASPKSGSPI